MSAPRTPADVFFRAWSRDRSRRFSSQNVRQVRVIVADATDLASILAAAYAAGASKGNGQTGIFEIQSDAGIWQGPMVDGALRPIARRDGSIDPRVCFRSWDDLDAAAEGEEVR